MFLPIFYLIWRKKTEIKLEYTWEHRVKFLLRPIVIVRILVHRKPITAITCGKRVYELLYQTIAAQDDIKTQVKAGMKLMRGKTDVLSFVALFQVCVILAAFTNYYVDPWIISWQFTARTLLWSVCCCTFYVRAGRVMIMDSDILSKIAKAMFRV